MHSPILKYSLRLGYNPRYCPLSAADAGSWRFALHLDQGHAGKMSTAADLHSVNAQIEVLLREAPQRRGIRIKPTDDREGSVGK